MAQRELSLIIDVDTGTLLSAFTSVARGSLPSFAFGDAVPIAARFVRRTLANPSLPWEDIDLTGLTPSVAIGTPAADPISGTFTLTYGANTTSALAYNATASQIATALNALDSITSAGGVTVTQSSGGVNRVIFTAVGDRAALTANVDAIYPTSSCLPLVVQEGNGSRSEIILFSIQSQPAAYVELTDDFEVAAVGISVVREGATGVGEIQSIALDPEPYAGAYTLTLGADTTGAIPFNATAEDIQSALEALAGVGAGNVTVSGDFPNFTASFDSSLGDISSLSGDATGLSVPTGKKGTLNLNTTGIVELLNGASSATAKFEAQLFDSGDAEAWTVLQQDCSVIQDVIPSNPADTPPLPTVSSLIADNAVLYSASQSLSSPQKTQALDNIAAATREANTFTGNQTAPAYLLDTSNKELRAGSNTLASADNGKSIYLTSSGSTQTLPTGLPFGFRVSLYNTSAGDITLAIDAGISVNGSSSSITIAPKSKLELTPTVDGGGGVVSFRAIASREPLSASTIWGRSSTGGASEKTVTDFAFSFLDDADATAARTTLVLGNVNNTSDAAKPVSTAQQTALDAKANLSGGNTISGSQTLTGQVELTGQAATNGTSAMTRDLSDARYVMQSRSALPTASYSSASGANRSWMTELWQIAAQTNGLAHDNGYGGLIVKGKFTVNTSTAGKSASLQIAPAPSSTGLVSGRILCFSALPGLFAINQNAGLADILTDTNQNRLKLHCSGVASRKLRYKFTVNFSANAGDVIVMSPSGHTFVVDDTITDATVWTNATTGGVSVRSVTSGGPPSASDTSLTVNGGSAITTTYNGNTATNSTTFPTGLLFVSSTGVHVMSPTFGDFGVFELVLSY